MPGDTVKVSELPAAGSVSGSDVGGVVIQSGVTKKYDFSVVKTFALAGVIGTANQVIATQSVGAVTLSLPQPIATTSSPTFASLDLSNTLSVNTISAYASGDITITALPVLNQDTGLKLAMRDGAGALHGYQAWYTFGGSRKGYFGYGFPGTAVLTLASEVGGSQFLAPTGASHDFQINSSSIFNISSSVITASAKIQCSVAPTVGSDLINKTYADSLPGLLPSWVNTFTANTGRDRYVRAQNSLNSTCYTGYMIETGVYNQYTIPTNYTTAPWFLGLYQDATADNDKCGIAQYGVGHYVSVYRRDQVAIGLNIDFEPRGTTAGHNRDDLSVLMKNNAMIKGPTPELFFNNTDQAGLNMQNSSIRMTDQGISFYGFNSNWDSRTLAMSIFTNPIGQEIAMFAKLMLNGGIVLPSDTPSPTQGALRYDGTNVQVHNGLIWRSLAYA